VSRLNGVDVKSDYERIRREAIKLAGTPVDLVQRSSVYFHLYQHSQHNHSFPLLAAHGALWGSNHFAKGAIFGRAASVASLGKPAQRQEQLIALAKFANAFKEINRQVCVETYVSYHMTQAHGENPDIVGFIPPDLCEMLNRCHHANRRNVALNAAEKRALFKAFFLWEQENIVGPGIDDAISKLDWPLILWLAMKPPVGFAYFKATKRLWFSNFASTEQRIQKGLEAFELATTAGWPRVEKSLGDYRIMPATFLKDPRLHFEDLKGSLSFSHD
jgi:hypothetical protein